MVEHSIGKTIAELRKAKGWTQVELAEKLNVSDKAVSKWEIEAGLPEISQLPVMAGLFSVTIDYLMTGRVPEKDVVAKSEAELCAQKDDVSLAERVKDLRKDENNKNIVDYILEYQSLKVFRKLCEIDSNFIQRFKITDAILFATLSNSLFLLRGKKFSVSACCSFTFENEEDIKFLLPAEDGDFFKDYQDKCVCILPRSYFSSLVADKRVNSTTLDILLSKQKGRECIWYHAFPYLIDEAYNNGNFELLSRLLTISKKNNEIAYGSISPIYDSYDHSYSHTLSYFFVVGKYGGAGHGLVRILERTIKTAMENRDFKFVKEFNEFNIRVDDFIKSRFNNISESFTKSKCYITSEDEIRVAMLKHDKTISENELKVQAAVHNGIICINELAKINDLDTINKALYKYPIHPFEFIGKFYQNGDMKALFRFAIDNKINDLADAVLSQNAEKIAACILNCWTNEDNSSYYRIKHLDVNKEDLYCDKKEVFYGKKADRTQTNLGEVLTYLEKVRERIIGEISDRIDKDKIIGELTKDYFYSELSKGNKEIVIIKLCVRMEAILKFGYHYEGDFSTMLDKFCEGFNTTDDECNNYDPDTPNMLDKLRKQRNGIVHSEKILSPMSDDEIKECIEYICSL